MIGGHTLPKRRLLLYPGADYRNFGNILRGDKIISLGGQFIKKEGENVETSI